MSKRNSPGVGTEAVEVLAGGLNVESILPRTADESRDFWFQLGWYAGQDSLRPELELAISDRDRYYRAAFAPRTPISVSKSYAEMEQYRAELYRGAK